MFHWDQGTQFSEEKEVTRWSSGQVPELDRRAHGRRPEEGFCNAAKFWDWRKHQDFGRVSYQRALDLRQKDLK